MTSGTLERALLLLVLAAAAARPAAAAGDAEVATFLATLAPPPQGAIPFVEQRMSALLESPLEVRGEISLGADGSIDKRVLVPVAERVHITAATLTLERGGQTRTVDLAGDARWKAFHAGITGLLNRDAAALARVFTVELEQAPGGWTLTLRPRRMRGANVVTLISASGTGPRLLTLRLEQGKDEWQEMSFPQAGS